MMEESSPVPEAPAEAGPHEIEYIGPPGQVSPALGVLIVGQRYAVDPALGAYLCAQHPTFWQVPRRRKEA